METRHSISHQRALEFMTAGKAIMTIQSKVTKKHFTFKFITPEENNGRQKPTWVRLLTGSDNDGSYTYLGTIWGNSYSHGKKSRVTEEALGVISFKWWFQSLVAGSHENLSKINLYHEGHCMKCGRTLTTPESIENGIGPVCAGIMSKKKLKYSVA